MSNRKYPKNGLGFSRLYNATAYSFKGFQAAWVYESAFRQEVVIGFLLLPISFFIAESTNHWILLFASLLFVLFAEIFNSAIEAVADAVTLEHHDMIGRAKDLGSSGVFIALIFLVIVWGDALVRVLI
ncbi:diacylglycerol kinase [Aliiglaciecola litoralis]|uniref:Diacylglycerol kinase n=1 Tax=Aliiglaciecola litoralis TaxID=582857 RepID=A0ABN1LC44_9ALTE